MCFFSTFFFFQAEDGIRDSSVTGVQTCALPILAAVRSAIAANPGARAFAFKQNLCWDMVNGIVFDHVRPSTPFVTTVWTRRQLRDWPVFSAAHFRAHGGDGLGDRGAPGLPPPVGPRREHP